MLNRVEFTERVAVMRPIARWLWGRRSWALAATPLAAVALVAALTASLLDRVVNCAGEDAQSSAAPGGRVCLPHVPDVAPIPAVSEKGAFPFAELRSRLGWSISVLFCGLAFAIMFPTAIAIAGTDLPRKVRWAARIIIAALPVATYVWRSDMFEFNKRLIGDTAYQVTGAELFVDWVVAFGHAAVLGLGLALAGILYEAQRAALAVPSQPRGVRAADDLARYHRYVRILLFAGALALVAGTVEATALNTWAFSMLTPRSGYVPAGANPPQAIGMLNGSFYSLFLAALFVPAFFVLRMCADRLAERAKPDTTPTERTKWLADYGIAVSIPQESLSVAAVLAPALVGGPITQIVEKLLGQ